jgi:chitodextrinase
LAAPSPEPDPVAPPIVPPPGLGSLADLDALPQLIGSGWLGYRGFSTTYETDNLVQDTGFSDFFRSASTHHLNATVTRPAGDDQLGTFYVVEYLVDYVKYGLPPLPQQDLEVLSIQRLDPGQSVSVQERYVEDIRYPDDVFHPASVVVTDQWTSFYVYQFSSDPFADADADLPPTRPTIEALERTNDSVWLLVSGGTDDKGIVGYNIYRDDVKIATVAPDNSYPDNTYTDVGLQYGSFYKYTARAIDTKGQLSPDSELLRITLDTTAPEAPTITTTDRTDTTVDLVVKGGKDDVGIVAYKIFRDNVLIATLTTDGIADVSYQDTGLTPETPYIYTARAYDLAGNESVKSSDLTVTTNVDTNPDDDPGGLHRFFRIGTTTFKILGNVIKYGSLALVGLGVIVVAPEVALAAGTAATIVTVAVIAIDAARFLAAKLNHDDNAADVAYKDLQSDFLLPLIKETGNLASEGVEYLIKLISTGQEKTVDAAKEAIAELKALLAQNSERSVARPE